MDVVKKVKRLQKIKNYLKSERFSEKKNAFIKYHEKKEGKKISENIKKICIDEKFFFFESESTKNILVYGIHESKKFYEFIFIQIYEIKNYSNFKNKKKSKFKFFSNYNEPGLFSILGPEGVGKSTLCFNIQNVLENSPIKFDTFHHTGAWKNKEKGSKVKKMMEIKKKIIWLFQEF